MHHASVHTNRQLRVARVTSSPLVRDQGLMNALPAQVGKVPWRARPERRSEAAIDGSITVECLVRLPGSLPSILVQALQVEGQGVAFGVVPAASSIAVMSPR